MEVSSLRKSEDSTSLSWKKESPLSLLLIHIISTVTLAVGLLYLTVCAYVSAAFPCFSSQTCTQIYFSLNSVDVLYHKCLTTTSFVETGRWREDIGVFSEQCFPVSWALGLVPRHMDLWKTGARATVEFALGLNVNEAKAQHRGLHSKWHPIPYIVHYF